MKAAAAVAIAVLGVLAVAPPAAGGPKGDPRDDKKRIDAAVAQAASVLEGATARAQQAAQQYAAANAALPGAQLRVAEARGQVVAAQVAANTAKREETAAQAALDQATQAYQQRVRDVDRARDRMGTFIAAAYKGSGFAAFQSLLAARSPADLADRIGYLDRVVETEQTAVDGLTAARRAAKQAQNDATLARRRAEAARVAADRALAQAQAAAVAAEQAQAEVTQLAGQRAGALKVAEQERSASLAQYEQVKQESAEIEAELRAWYAAQKPAAQKPAAPRPPKKSSPGTGFLMPVNGWKSSDFGMRYDPYYRVWQLHAGTDFAAPGGAPIYAAADGRVVLAGWRGGYGNYTCLGHGSYRGQGLTTCYAHQSRIGVSVGERVRRGQVIGRVGTTGASTGYHLHFEVRLDGVPHNPLPWLPGCLC
jgi:murein DD-endopeptidase MepM/ murein hydrolase activator NlpD